MLVDLDLETPRAAVRRQGEAVTTGFQALVQVIHNRADTDFRFNGVFTSKGKYVVKFQLQLYNVTYFIISFLSRDNFTMLHILSSAFYLEITLQCYIFYHQLSI